MTKQALAAVEAPTVPAQGAITLMDMVDRAIASGNVDIVGKMMDYQERWEKNEARKAFDTAVAEAKGKFKPVVKNRKAHNSTYADFAAIANAVDPILTEHGLSYRFRSEQGERISVTCILSHRSGHSEETTLTGPADNSGSKNAIQAIGSTLTYLQRYTLVQMLGLAASDDDDGQAGGTEPISSEQLTTLQAAIVEAGADIEKFCKAYGIEDVKDLPANRYADAIRRLEAKRAQK